MKNTLLLLFLCIACQLPAQLPYTQKLYDINITTDVTYGSDVDFAGHTVDLKMDIYKPVNNPYCNRPILVMIHGGAFIGGDKTDYGVSTVAQEYAKRGYVVASINYRLGTHKRNYYEQYALCSNFLPNQPCLYSADSSEFIRAAFRAMQDAKGAIRFMKQRHAIDSTDSNIAFVGGESAGAITSFLVAFMTSQSEKPADCFAIANAPTPDPDLAACLPANYSLARPNLGSVQGTLNTSAGYDAKVLGLLDFFGAVMDTSILNEADKPAVYMFHQYGDLVVDCGTQPLIQPMYTYCINPINLCQPLDHVPYGSGACSLAPIFQSQGYGIDKLLTELVTTTTYNCFANPPQHAIDDPFLRSAHSSLFFAVTIAAHGNVPGCVSGTLQVDRPSFTVYPTVADQSLTIIQTGVSQAFNYQLISPDGSILQSGKLPVAESSTLDVHELGAGLYFILIENERARFVRKFIKQ